MCQACGEKGGVSAPVLPPSLRAWYINRTFTYSQVRKTYPKEELSYSFQRTYRGIGEARKNQSGKRTQLRKRSVGNLGKNHGSNSENDRSSCTASEMIPTPQWPPTLKWSPNRHRNDPHFSSRRPRNDPQLILGMEWYSFTELLQVCCSVYVLESHSTFHYRLCDFLALLSSNRLYVYFCILNIILKF